LTDITTIRQFWSAARASASAGELMKLTLSKPRHKASNLPRNRYARLVELKGVTQLQITHRYSDREEVKNHLIGKGISLLESALGEDFGNADLFTTTEQLSLTLTRKGNARFQRKVLHEPSQPLTKGGTEHNRKKHRDIPADRPYLHALGITTADGKVRQDGMRKFKQINKFVEIIDGLVRDNELPTGAQIVDMGSGSGYLTFALYDHLVNRLCLDVTVTGVELRPNLVEKCRAIAKENHFKKLRFVEGYIDDFNPDSINLLIALHACDTATDDALFKGLKAKSQMMVVAPCCQKQVRQDMVVPDDLKPMLGNGILLERQAAMLTDAMRALLLESEGYKTKLFEFIPLEHTAKNVMITAVKGKERPEALEEFRVLREKFGVKKHYLRKLIKNAAAEVEAGS
jgi:SAM-dependent methyltransferase